MPLRHWREQKKVAPVVVRRKQERRDAGKVQDWKDAGKEGFRVGRMQERLELEPGGMQL